MSDDLSHLLDCLNVEQIDKFLCIGRSPSKRHQVFGGQVFSQALNAAICSVDSDLRAHSMHGYFLRPGNPEKPIIFAVESIRDSRSFATRLVIAKQDDQAILNASVSFQGVEEGLEHQMTAPQAAGPDNLESKFDYFERIVAAHPGRFRHPAPGNGAIDHRPVDMRDHVDPANDIREPVNASWMRAGGRLNDDPIQHQTVLAYMSDMAVLSVALNPHPYCGMEKNIMAATLGHALWFHQPFRADEWLLYYQDSPIAHSSRTLIRGGIYNEQGKLVASTAQEGLFRLLKSQ